MLLSSCGRKSAPGGRLNLVLVTIDTLRADRLGCYGYSQIETPNLDRLAKKGVLFENAVAQAPLTAPSHASMFTGVYPTVHTVRDTGGFVLPASQATLASILQQQGWDTAAFIGASVLNRRFGLNQGFAVYDDEMPKPAPGQPPAEHPERAAGEVVDRSIQWLNTQSGKPYFLWAHVYDPHYPYNPPSPFREQYQGRPYDGEVAYADRELGRLFDAVAKKSPGNTLIVVLSDHGESLSEHGEYMHGVFLYDSTLRIAFMMSGPGVPEGVRVKQQARSIDLLPTLLELMGGKSAQRAQGVSLTPAFTGKEVRTVYSYEESLYPKLNLGWAELRGIRTNRWKYVRAPKPELYDLSHDPAEAANVIASHPAEVRELEAVLNKVIQNRAAEKVQTTVVDQGTMNQLKSLGYLGGSSQQQYELTGRGIDPKDRVGVLKLLFFAESPEPPIPASARLAMLRQALAEDPTNPDIYFHLGAAYQRLSRYGEAMKLYQDGIARGVRNDWVYARLGYLYHTQGNKEAAIASWAQAAQLNPSDHETMGNLALAYLESGKIADAERVCNWILKTGVEYGPAYNIMGLASIKKRDLPQARVYLEKAIQADPNLLDAYLNLGRIYTMIGANSRARVTFEAFLAKASPAEYGAVIPKVKAELAAMQ